MEYCTANYAKETKLILHGSLLIDLWFSELAIFHTVLKCSDYKAKHF